MIPGNPQIYNTAQGPLNDASNVIAASGVAQTALTAGGPRTYLIIQNVGTTDFWMNFGADATAARGSIKIKGGDNLGTMVFEGSFICSQRISIIGTAGGEFTLKYA